MSSSSLPHCRMGVNQYGGSHWEHGASTTQSSMTTHFQSLCEAILDGRSHREHDTPPFLAHWHACEDIEAFGPAAFMQLAACEGERHLSTLT